MEKEQKKAPDKIWNKEFTSIFLASCVFYLGLNTMMTMIPKFASTMTDAATLVGLVSSAFAVSALVLKVVAGPATDTFSKKKVIIFASILMAGAFFGYSISNSVQMLILFRLLQGTAQAFTAIALLALASDYLPKSKMTSGIGIFSLGQTACQALAPAFGLKLANTIGYHAMCAVCGGLVLVAVAMIATLKDDFVKTKKFRITLKGIAVKEALVPAFIMGLLIMTYSMVSSYLLIYAEKQGVDGISSFFTINACVMLISRPTIGKMAEKHGTIKVMIPALVLFALTYFMISGATKLWVYILAAIIMGVSYGACQPLIQALCIKTVGPERRGGASNTNYIGYDMGNMLGPIIAGSLVDRFDYDFTWKMATVPVLVAIVVLLLWRKQAAAIEQGFENRV